MRRLDLERAAQAYATSGLAVFPLRPAGKTPLRKGWQTEATTDPGAVHQLWQAAPDANIGVRTGNGLIVLDGDTERALDGLDLPDTTTVATRRGRHLYLAGDAPNRVAVRPGLDVRGQGGYAVGAGSVHPAGGRYQWIVPPWETPPALAPATVIDLARERRARRDDHGPIPEGRRNTTLTRRGGMLRRAGLSRDATVAALVAENQARCRPPLHRAEVERIARSVSSMAGPPAWIADALRYAEDPRLDAKARQVLHVLACRARDDGTVYGGDWLTTVTGLHRNRISEAVRQLEHHGRIAVTRRRRKASIYTLTGEIANREPECGGGRNTLDTQSGTACTHSVNQESAATTTTRAS